VVPSLVVVVVVVVVLEVCPQANGATTASAMLSNVFFMMLPSVWLQRARRSHDSPSLETGSRLPLWKGIRIGKENWTRAKNALRSRFAREFRNGTFYVEQKNSEKIPPR